MGIVYKLLCNETGECYIGSANTKKNYNDRRSGHKQMYEGKLCSSSKIIERGNYTFSIIEENIFIDIELRKREQYWMDISDHVINSKRAYTSPELAKQQHKEWREANKDIIKEKHIQYYLDNRDHKIAYDVDYYNAKKEIIKAQKREPVLCECGLWSQRGVIARHRKTKKHQDYLSLIQIN